MKLNGKKMQPARASVLLLMIGSSQRHVEAPHRRSERSCHACRQPVRDLQSGRSSEMTRRLASPDDLESAHALRIRTSPPMMIADIRKTSIQL
jgi:hypothetical protein